MYIWDSATGQQLHQLTSESGYVGTLTISPDGTWLATGHDAAVEIWDIPTGRQRQRLTGDPGFVYAVAIAPNGAWLATTGFDGTVRIWDVKNARVSAITRIEYAAQFCVWQPRSNSLFLAGVSGLYNFAFHPRV